MYMYFVSQVQVPPAQLKTVFHTIRIKTNIYRRGESQITKDDKMDCAYMKTTKKEGRETIIKDLKKKERTIEATNNIKQRI